MTSQPTQETFVPVFVSQEEYNQILQQPSYLHQQLLQELYQKKQQQTQLQASQQMHPYLQLQQQTLNQSQNQNVSINIPKIPTSPNQNSQPQGYPYHNSQLQQQLLYQNQNQIQNQNNLPKVQNQHLKHTSIQKAGTQERKFFFQTFTTLFMVEICISLFFNTISALTRLQVVTSNYTWGPGLWAVLILFILLNLFIITNTTYITQGTNQFALYWIHLVLYVLLLQGMQTAVSGSDIIFSWDTNYFYYFYLLICVEFISVRYAIKHKGVKKPIQEYLIYLIFPPIIAYSVEFFSQYYRFFYVPLFLWLLVVILIGFGCMLLMKKIEQKGYNNFKTNHVFAMAMSFPILMISPFYDEE